MRPEISTSVIDFSLTESMRSLSILAAYFASAALLHSMTRAVSFQLTPLSAAGALSPSSWLSGLPFDGLERPGGAPHEERLFAWRAAPYSRNSGAQETERRYYFRVLDKLSERSKTVPLKTVRNDIRAVSHGNRILGQCLFATCVSSNRKRL